MKAIATINNGIQARAYAGEIEGGADVLEYVGGIVVAAVLISAMIIFGKLLSGTINTTGTNINNWFNTTTSGVVGK